MKTNQSPGVEGWRVRELKQLPRELLDMLACILNLIEDTGIWPGIILQSLVTLIPKGEGVNPLSLRPISVTSLIYRLWAATRLRDVSAWQEHWVEQSQMGFRPGKGTVSMFMAMAAKIEKAVLDGEDIVITSLDYQKCFDLIPHTILLRTAEECGLDPRVLRPLRAMYSGLTRRYRYDRAVGEPHRATNGLLQGCPLSPLLLNALIAVWTRAVETEAGAEVLSYADDTNIIGSGGDAAAELSRAYEVTADYLTLTGQVVNAKSFTLTANPRRADLPLFAGHRLTQEDAAKILGTFADIRLHGPARADNVMTRRQKSALLFADRVTLLPLTAREKGLM